jgi:hypothetical protein
MLHKFRVRIDKGRLVVDDPSRFKAYLQSNDGERGSMTFPEQDIRTNSQNRYYFGVVIRTITDHTGDDKDSMHEYLKGRFGLYKEVEVQGNLVKVYKSTASMTKPEFTEYIDSIKRWAADPRDGLSLYIPDAGEVDLPAYY